MTRERRLYKTRRSHRALQMKYRDRRSDAGLCINADTHGPATHGVLCAACRVTHRRSA